MKTSRRFLGALAIAVVPAAILLGLVLTPHVHGQGAKIFVPTPKGSGETLDDSVKDSGPVEKTDVVVTTQGDRLLGSIVAMDSAGKLRLAGPQYEGEVGVQSSAVDCLYLRGSDKPSGNDEIVLTNNDRVTGTVSAITPEGIFIETEAAGRLKVAPKVVRTINMNRPENILLESSFNTGRLEPWTSTTANMWTLVDNAMVCNTRGNSSGPVFAKLDQKEAITMVAKVEGLQGNGLSCALIVFADTPENDMNSGRFGRNSLVAQFNNSECYLQYTNNGNTNHIANRSFGRSAMGGILRLAYDPTANKAHIWLDNNDLGEYAVPNRPANGKYVMLNSYYPLKVEWIRVVRGVVGPSSDDDVTGAAAKDGGTIVQFTNKDRVSVTDVGVADGQVTLKTSYGEIRCPAKSVARIMYSEKGMEEPRRQPGDVRVVSGVGRLTLRFERLTADVLVGHSDYLGDIKVQRAAIREIKFNLYRS
jgi:hypothetical protein